MGGAAWEHDVSLEYCDSMSLSQNLRLSCEIRFLWLNKFAEVQLSKIRGGSLPWDVSESLIN